jgi:hypothetical protein
MNTAKYFLRLSVLSFFLVIISSNLNAQRGRHYEIRERGYHSYYSRPIVSIGFGYRNYGYYPYYSPAYRYYPGGSYFGLRIGALPFGFSTIYIGPHLFYYYDGTYYRPYGDNEYEVTAPPLGAKVPELPRNSKVTVIDGQKYYESNGTYYKEEITDSNDVLYKVVGTNGKLNTGNNVNSDAAIDNNNSSNNNSDNDNSSIQNNDRGGVKIGDRVDELPADSKVVVINKQKYFQSPSGYYYQEVVDGNKIHYEVVGKSSDGK